MVFSINKKDKKMLEFPQMLTEEEQKHVKSLEDNEGWIILQEIFNVSIKIIDSKLANWTFETGDNGEPLIKSIKQFEKWQLQNILVKELLAFIENGGIISSEQEFAPKLSEDRIYE